MRELVAPSAAAGGGPGPFWLKRARELKPWPGGTLFFVDFGGPPCFLLFGVCGLVPGGVFALSFCFPFATAVGQVGS